MTFYLLHLPDAICFYRIFASIIALILGPHPATPWLFSSALISDLFDGYIYRKYVVNHPKWKTWWPLPISLDPIGDLTLGMCGIMYACVYLYHSSWLIACCAAAFYALFAFLCVTLPNIVPERIFHLTYMVCINATTHVTCLLMVHAAIVAWAVHTNYWFFYATATIAVFYYLFTQFGTPSRLIRRPPADFRKSS